MPIPTQASHAAMCGEWSSSSSPTPAAVISSANAGSMCVGVRDEEVRELSDGQHEHEIQVQLDPRDALARLVHGRDVVGRGWRGARPSADQRHRVVRAESRPDISVSDCCTHRRSFALMPRARDHESITEQEPGT